MVYWPVFTSLCTYHNTLTTYSWCWYLLGQVLVLVFCLIFHGCFDHLYTHSVQYEPYFQLYKFSLRFLIEIIGWRSPVGCSPWGCWGSDTTEWLHFHFSLSFIGGGNGTLLQYSCLENPRDGGAWWAAVYGVTQSQTRLKWLGSSNKRKRERDLFLPWASMWGHREKVGVCKTGRVLSPETQLASTLIGACQCSETWGKLCSLSHAVSGLLLQQPEQTKTLACVYIMRLILSPAAQVSLEICYFLLFVFGKSHVYAHTAVD